MHPFQDRPVTTTISFEGFPPKRLESYFTDKLSSGVLYNAVLKIDRINKTGSPEFKTTMELSASLSKMPVLCGEIGQMLGFIDPKISLSVI
jgi:hypothetical protein